MKSLLNKLLLSTVLSLSALNASAEVSDQPSAAAHQQSEVTYLSTNDRPTWLRRKIRDSSSARVIDWPLDGRYNDPIKPVMYSFYGATSDKIVMQYVRLHPEQTEFNILDFGTGQGGFLVRLAESISEQLSTLRPDVTVNIYGITGGAYKENFGDPTTEIGRCNVRHIDNTRIDHDSRFSKIPETTMFDVVFSRSTFQHLTDPVGTLVDTFQRIKPDGYFFGDFPTVYRHLIVLNTTPDIAHTLSSTGGYGGHNDTLVLQRADAVKGLSILAKYSPTEQNQPYVDIPEHLPPYETIHHLSTNSDAIKHFLASNGIVNEPDLVKRSADIYYVGLIKKTAATPDIPLSQLTLTENEYDEFDDFDDSATEKVSRLPSINTEIMKRAQHLAEEKATNDFLKQFRRLKLRDQ